MTTHPVTSTKRVALAGAGTAVVVALLFGYPTSTSGPTASTPQSAVISSDPASTAGSAGSTASTGSASHAGAGKQGLKQAHAAAKPATKTVTGAVAQTQWGPVQVRLTASGTNLTKVDVLQYPHGNGNDAQINGYALPILVQETMKAQSAHIDMVSGATITSTGYLQSLQSALDQLPA